MDRIDTFLEALDLYELYLTPKQASSILAIINTQVDFRDLSVGGASDLKELTKQLEKVANEG